MTGGSQTHPAAGTGVGHPLAGTTKLWRLIIRRDRVLAGVVIVGLSGLLLGTAAQYARLFPTEAARRVFVDQLAGNSALIAFTGRLYGDSPGNLVMWKIGDIAFTLVGLLALLLVIRHTRTEEEQGRAELTGSTVVGPLAPLAAAVLHAVAVSMAIGTLSAAALALFGLDPIGCLAFGTALAMPGVVFAAVAALSAQLATQAATASRLAAGVLGASYLTRFLADGSGTDWLRWCTPLGWSHLVMPYGPNRFVVALPALLLAAMLIMVAGLLRRHRDLGAGVVVAGAGPATAGAGLNSELGLAWRQHRGLLLIWLVAVAALAVATSSIAGGMGEIVDRSGDFVQELFRRYAARPDAPIAETFVWSILYSIGGFGSLLPMMIMLRLRTEEVSGRAELLLSHPLSRLRWASAQIGFALLGGAAVMIIGGAAAGLGFGLSTTEPGATWIAVVAAAVVLIPPMWLTASVAMLAVGLLPRAATAIVWAVFLLVNLFGESVGPVIGIDYAVADLIVPFHHAPKVLTGAPFTPGPTMIMIVAAFGILALGVLALRHRDLR